MTNQRPTLIATSGDPVGDNRSGEALASAWI